MRNLGDADEQPLYTLSPRLIDARCQVARILKKLSGRRRGTRGSVQMSDSLMPFSTSPIGVPNRNCLVPRRVISGRIEPIDIHRAPVRGVEKPKPRRDGSKLAGQIGRTFASVSIDR